ncbi:hypothetical protein Dsin_021655 [Dipteronia sinensis]|uniref:RNase H type-1 domain-containing protein n=1 Tax=Dipteronia sinensis TaxID=43782 RepID=A0AAE0A022_9ROSI|nr:hypothetical protein Dsin_021655 [Dipteronia sinensis]
MDNNWSCSIQHVYREGNRVADGLANLGHSLELRITFFDDPPPQILGALDDDFRSNSADGELEMCYMIRVTRPGPVAFKSEPLTLDVDRSTLQIVHPLRWKVDLDLHPIIIEIFFDLLGFQLMLNLDLGLGLAWAWILFWFDGDSGYG